MPRNPAPEAKTPKSDEFDPTKVNLRNLKNPDKIAAKIEAARLEHNKEVAESEPKPDAKSNWSGDDATPASDVKDAGEKILADTGLHLEPGSAPPVQVIERRIETVTVEIPLGEPPHRFQTIHLEALLYGDHAQTFARLRQALRDKGTRTADGKEVRSGPDILRWLLEQFATC